MTSWTFKPGYPPANYNGHTTDAGYCPWCGQSDVTLLGGFSSRQRVGVCQICAANFVVDPVQAELAYIHSPGYEQEDADAV